MIVPVLVAALAAQTVAQGTHSDTSIRRLPARIAHDTRHLATRTPLLTLGIGGVLSASVYPADTAIERHIHKFGTLDETLDAGSALGDGWVQWTTAATVYGTGLVLRTPAVKDVGTRLLEAQVLSGVFTQVVKYAVNRQRPDGGRYSFPSGHTSASFTTADVLEQQYGWKIGALAYGAAACVPVSRLAEHEHYLSDVLFGAAVGIAASRATGRAHGPARAASLHGFTIVPIATRGGFMVLFTRTAVAK